MSFVHIRNFTFHLFDRQTNGYGQVAMLCIPIRARKEKTGIWVPRRVPAQVISQKRNITIEVASQDCPMFHGAPPGVLRDGFKHLLPSVVGELLGVRGSKVSVVNQQRPRLELDARELYVAPSACVCSAPCRQLLACDPS